jgi:hypothetical protein
VKHLFRFALCVVPVVGLLHTSEVRAVPTATPSFTKSDSDLGIVSQPFNILSSVNARFVVEATSKAIANEDNLFQVQLHRRVASPDSLTDIANRTAVAGVIDTVTIPLSRIPRDTNGYLTPLIPITVTTQNVGSLTVSFDGIYPVTLRIVDVKTGEVISSVLTFINKRDTKTEQKEVRATTILRIASDPSLQPDGSVEVSDNTRSFVRSSIGILRENRSPITISLQPELVVALAVSPEPNDQVLLADLAAQLQQRSLTSVTFADSDVSMMAAMSLDDEFVRQLRLGEDTLNRLLPGITRRSATYISDAYLDTAGVSLLRKAGVSSLILLPESQTDTKADAPRGMISRPNGRDNGLMSVVMADSGAAKALEAATTSSRHVAYRVAAELLVKRDFWLTAGQNPEFMRLVLSTPTGRLDNFALLGVATRALASAPGITMTDMASPRNVSESTPFINLRPQTPNTGESRRSGLTIARSEINAVSSMVDDADPRRLRWEYTLGIATSNISSAPTTYVSGVRAQLRATRQSVTVTTPKSITLSSRTGSIRLQLRNNSEAPLTVRVRLSSAKLQLTNADRTVTLASGGTTEVVVPATTRTNGSFPVAVWVSTPRGNIEVAPFVTITAKVTAIAGLGQLVSISLLFILLAWWWSNRRKARLEANAPSTVSS